VLDVLGLRGQGRGLRVMFAITFGGMVLGWFLGKAVAGLARGDQIPDQIPIA
jgi:hypothetical protein